jgi:CRISPR-associated protein Cpf1
LFLYENIYNLEGIRNKEYDELGAFYDDIEKRMYSLNFSKVADSFIDGMIKSGDFYFFQIYNKDFSSYKKIGGTENIHTKYFKLLFGSDNLKDLCIKLSG